MKKRIIGFLPIKNNIVVQSIGYNNFLPVGDPAIAVEFLNSWGIDEILVVDLDNSRNDKCPNLDLLEKIAKKSFVPLTFGGGITTIEQVRSILKGGADKVSLNSILLNNINFLTEISSVFGKSSIVASVDAIQSKQDGEYYVYDYISKKITNLKVADYVTQLEKYGAGEILVNSVENDGACNGLNVELYKKIENLVNCPIIACGGTKDSESLMDLFNQTKIDSVAIGNSLHFSEHSVILLKASLRQKNVNVRVISSLKYLESSISEANRIEKYPDVYLENLLFEKIQKEFL